MKLTKMVLSLVLFASLTFAQEKEYTKEDWQRDMQQLTEQKAQLQKDIAATKEEVKKLKDQLAGMKTEEEAMNELYALVGATKADVDAYRNKVNDLEQKVRTKTPEVTDRENELNELLASKIAALPEFYGRLQAIKRAIASWKEEIEREKQAKKEETKEYTVVRGDCLWNIAKKKDIYANPLAWPNIYKANRDQIKNPNLIYPKQTFKIPALSDEEKARYDRIRSNYKPAPRQTAN
ncbi:MAG TPA: LysM peptidoglycan-binding domain-containing protein [Ignavibacteriales bacterium]|nr:LysM peptidoglycan-binding domain-containing protein [Ignavibacteriales bacterium]HOL81993.1 LysM peptidoglycan-binding domain-containing protein [Ignavibacteriales bacterium]HOM64963.1 LysM peptidoglycan-binding domain-containing protein [Ignavibacteriales bacterium]HPD68315.1 LysM peptidoglycan-binding domain-containing protein [Ignavibacteriales bacterium]HPP34130.1 LysM peptidoglycan-binding domain-containing protein [Ignavibacteriales bacterium]